MFYLLLISWALFAGLLMTRITNIFKLPDVTAYLIVGVIIGPSILGRLGIKGIGFISFEEVESLSIISDVALGFIAFSIGNEFKLKEIKNIGKQVVTIGIFQAVAAALCVDITLIILHFIMPNIVTVPMAITLGAIAAATAPAATLMVIKQYKAKGPVTDILLPVVALDDAVGLVVFAASFGTASAIISGNANVLNLIVEPVLEIMMSLLLGSVAALILTYLESKFHSNTNRLILIIGSIVITVAIAKASFQFGRFGGSFSPLLVCMMLGTVFCNICPLSDELMDISDKWSQPILVLFFVLSGAELDLRVFNNPIVIMVGIIYILARSFGKYIGARISADMVGSKDVIKKYLGITLLPQAGVALGMSAIVARSLGTNGLLIRNITLFGVLIYELIGPTMTKIALTKAGEIKEKPKEVVNRRNNKLKAARRKELIRKIFKQK